MPKLSLAQLNKQIANLQAQAEKLRNQQKSEVIAQVRETISEFGLTMAELFGKGARKAASVVRGSKSKSGRTVAYSDGNGNEWVGRGPRPRWLGDALAKGASLEDFAVGKQRAAARGKAETAHVEPSAKKAGGKPAAKKVAPKKAATKAAGKKLAPARKSATAKKVKAAPAKKAAAKRAERKAAKVADTTPEAPATGA